jgi:RHS repeat-associated protein
LTVTVTDVSGNVATQVVNVTVVNGEPVSIGYDANGNQTNHNGWAMTYDRENRLTEARSQESVVSYTYDPLGRLIRRVAYTNDSGSWILTSDSCLYYAGWQLIAEYDGDGNLQRKYVYGPGIDEPIRMTSGGANYYYHADGLGSVTKITDVTGNLVESYQYDVFGTPTMYDHSAIRISQSAIGNRLLFTGRDYDPDTGWYNYRYRYYNPALGRFVQRDPVGLAGGSVNLYGYCRNNPVTLVDAFGLEWQFSFGVGGVLGGHPVPGIPGPFVGGGASLGFTSTGRFFIQFQASGMVGPGFYAGVGLQGGVGYTKCTLRTGVNTGKSIHAEGNLGFGDSVGGAIDVDTTGASLTGPPPRLRAGVGFGIMAAAGMSTTTTIATPTVGEMYNRAVDATAGIFHWIGF